MEPAPPPLSTEANLGRILLYVGAAMAAFSALVMLFMAGLFFLDIPDAPRGMLFLPLGLLTLLGVLALAGIIVNLVAAARVRQDARMAGILGIVAAMLPPTNLFSLAGGILLMISPEAKQARAAPAFKS